MKILQISTFSYKAAGNIMLNIHNALREKGIDSYVAWGRGRKAQNEFEYYMGDSIGVKLHGVYTRVTDKHGFASRKATKKLLDWVDSIHPDIIHLHCIHGYYINIEMLFNYIKERKIKVIWTQHDCWSFTGHCAYYDASGCEKWKTGCHNCQQLNTYPASLFFDNSAWNWRKKKELFSGVDMTIVTPCEWLAQEIKSSFLREYPITVIYNGIDTAVFKFTDSNFREKYGIENKKIILGVAGEWTERKGLKDFIELSTRIDMSKYVIVVVGVTEKQKNMLPSQFIALKRTENVQELGNLYSVADVYFNPTYEDNFPTTNLEAIACGTQLITYDTGGCSECINDKEGIVIHKGDIEKVVDFLRESDFEKLPEDKRFVFSKKDMIRRYIKLYYEKNS